MIQSKPKDMPLKSTTVLNGCVPVGVILCIFPSAIRTSPETSASIVQADEYFNVQISFPVCRSRQHMVAPPLARIYVLPPRTTDVGPYIPPSLTSGVFQSNR